MFKTKITTFCLIILMFFLISITGYSEEVVKGSYNKIPIVPFSVWKVVENTRFESSVFDDFDFYSEAYVCIVNGDLIFKGFDKIESENMIIRLNVIKVVEMLKNNSKLFYYVCFDNEEFMVIIEPKDASVFVFYFFIKSEIKKDYIPCIKMECVRYDQ